MKTSAESSARWPASVQRSTTEALPAFTQLSGPPMELEAEALRTEAERLEAELAHWVKAFAHEQLQAYREQTRNYLAELRQHFLRHHRRLSVRVRSEEASLERAASAEAGELAQRFRDAVLARASRLRHEPWTFVDTLEEGDRILSSLPEEVKVPFESGSFAGSPEDGVWTGFRRAVLRMRRRVRRWMGLPPRQRRVPLQALARYHLQNRWASDLEASLAVWVQGEQALNHRTWVLFEGIEAAFRRIPQKIEAGEDPDPLLGQLRNEVEEEFRLAEQEQQRHAEDGLKRMQATLAEGMGRIKQELAIIATFELPSRRRTPALSKGGKAAQQVRGQLHRVQDALRSSYNLTALRYELYGYRSDVDEAMAEALDELQADVRGRSFLQIERVQSTLENLLQALDEGRDPERGEGFRELLEPMERVVQEAVRAERQLEEQLRAESATAPLVDALTRGASSLSERYRVPQSHLPRSEWKLPAAPAVIEVPFASVVQAFVQTEVAPQLSERSSHAAASLAPLAAALSDLERMVQFHPEEGASDFELDDRSHDGPDSIRQALTAAGRTHRETLKELSARSESWARDLAAELRQKVHSQLEQLESRFSPEGVRRVRAPRRPVEPGKGLRGRLTAGVGELQRWMDAGWEWGLTLTSAEPEAEPFKHDLSPPRTGHIPTFYRRLLGSAAHWAGDVVPAAGAAIDRARQLLTEPSGLRTVSVIGVDSAARGAVVSAILQGAAFPSIRRVNLLRPTPGGELRQTLQELGRGNLVIVTGLGFLIATEPGGFEPLRELVRLVLEDDGRNGWILEGDELTWRYASQVALVEEAVMEEVEVRRLERSELARAIFARHHLSGRTVRFTDRDRFEEASSDGGEEEKRGSLRFAYFQKLHRSSEGLLQVALSQWMSSIQKFGAERVDVSLRVASPKESLRQLPAETLNLLYLILRQGWMSSSTLAFVLQTDGAEAEARLRRLAHLGLLERSSEGWYTVRGHLRGLLHRTLTEAGYL